MKKGKFLMEQKDMGQLTETPGHAWPRVRPKLYLLLAYKRRGRGTIWKRKKYREETLPIYIIHCPNPLAFLYAKGDLTQSSWRTEEEEPRIRFKERWPVSTLIVS
jgi:hypothetical protein